MQLTLNAVAACTDLAPANAICRALISDIFFVISFLLRLHLTKAPLKLKITASSPHLYIRIERN